MYEALVVLVMMYNSSCCVAPKSAQEKLDIVHTHHLRSIWNYRNPNIVSNINLYVHRRCNVEPLSARVDRNRWRLLGHVFSGPCGGPANISLVFAIIVDVLSDKSCGSKIFMSQNLTYYTSLKRSN